MNLFVAMDLLDGQVTRLREGRFVEATSYGPVEEGLHFLREGGATHLHLVDLNAARDPRDTTNKATLSQVIKEWTGWLEVGGGLRDVGSIHALLASGVDRVVVGTAAVTRPDFLARLEPSVRENIAVALDYSFKSGTRRVAYNGWVAMDPPEFTDTLTRVLDSGVSAILATATERDGTLTEPDYETYQELIDHYSLSVIASGGVSTLSSLNRLASLKGKLGTVEAAIVGKAIWERTFTIAEGMRACRTSA